MLLSDAELVRAAQRGDAVSLGILLERHRAPLHALALRMLGHEPQAQDAVQDAFLIALSTIDRLREPEAVGGWLRGILRNVCLTRLKESRRQVLFDELPRRVEANLSESSAEESIDRLAMRDWVWTALLELPEALRITAMLRYFGSYASYEEIAAILGVPVGTVRSRLSRIKARLADALLETAGLEHDGARLLRKSQIHYWTAAWDEYNKGKDYEMWVDPFSDDPAWTYPDGSAFRGRAYLVGELEGDLEAGMKFHLTNVLASKDVTVIEGDFENPPDNPFHCPPATSMVLFYRDGQVHLLRQYFAPRPQSRPQDREQEAMHDRTEDLE